MKNRVVQAIVSILFFACFCLLFGDSNEKPHLDSVTELNERMKFMFPSELGRPANDRLDQRAQRDQPKVSDVVTAINNQQQRRRPKNGKIQGGNSKGN